MRRWVQLALMVASTALLGNLQGKAIFNSALANQRLCVNCHSQVHGSNSPNGAYFFR